ncbi:MAG: hypothetical protein GXO50_05915, partial [Chlorobi bacterium]|nr:hypothetical protein [Chlorobiota bacterium]
KKAISHNTAPEELKKYFEQAVPEYDKDRVYTSDIKKIIKWYNILIDANILEFNEDEKNENTEKESGKKDENTKTK